MEDDTTIMPLHQPGSVLDPLTEIVRDGARRMLAAALRAEAASFVAQFDAARLPDGRGLVAQSLPGIRIASSAAWLSGMTRPATLTELARLQRCAA